MMTHQDVDDASELPGLLDQIKGARVELKLGTETVTGTIVSARTFAGTDKQPEHDQLNLMLDTGEFRTVAQPVPTASAFSMAIPQGKKQRCVFSRWHSRLRWK